MGKLLNKLKYKNDWSAHKEIADTAVQFLLSQWKRTFDLLIAVPSYQKWANDPLVWLAKAIGQEAGIPVSDSCLARVKKLPKLKNSKSFDDRKRLLEDAHKVTSIESTKGKRILVFDDLIESGSTLSSITELLQSEGQAAEVSVLAICSTLPASWKI